MFYWNKKHLTAILENSLNNDAETLGIKMLVSKNNPIHICSYYRPPNNDINPIVHRHESMKILISKETTQFYHYYWRRLQYAYCMERGIQSCEPQPSLWPRSK